jgi:L-rhamnose mutarotase
MKTRYCLALDLKDDPGAISEYRKYHENVWPEITRSIKAAGIEDMEIYLTGNRLFMVLETDESFSFEAKNRTDRENPKVQEWERLMSRFQQPLPWGKPGEKWMPMERVFKLEEEQ